MAGVKFNLSSAKKIARVVRTSTSTPTRVSQPSSRRISQGQAGSSSDSSLYPFKTTITSEEEVYTVTIAQGQVVLPDGQELMDEYSFTIAEVETAYVYLKISGTQAVLGGWENFTAEIINSSDEQVNTNLINYFLISIIKDLSINQQRTTTFDSGATIL